MVASTAVSAPVALSLPSFGFVVGFVVGFSVPGLVGSVGPVGPGTSESSVTVTVTEAD